MVENYSTANKSILGTIEFALRTLCVISEPDAKLIDVSVTAFNRPFEASKLFSKIPIESRDFIIEIFNFIC